MRVEEDKGGREFKTINGGKFLANRFLNVDADDVKRCANADFVFELLFKLVNDGLKLGAGNSERGLEFKQHGRAGADRILYAFGVIHQRGLARM